MNARWSKLVRARVPWLVAGPLLSALSLSSSATAQTPPAGAPPPSAPPAGTDAPGSPPPGEAPPPLATSPLLNEEPAPPPPEPTYQEPPPPPPEPDQPPDEPRARSAGPFSRGSVRLSLLIGTGYTPTDNYLILGGGVGYYLLDGLELGVDYEAWFLAEPVMHRLSPGLRYVFHMIPVIKPYVGGFYRHTFVGNNIDDLDYLGARLGVYYVPPNGGVYVGGGAVYEHLLDCTNGAFVDCDSVYPEIFVGISF
ncbi:MAG TPA: hypothetical protein VFV94_07590 [Polyangiaceae bacterium]|nr:hypothetical protein [Polyangiaceae bacterium]